MVVRGVKVPAGRLVREGAFCAQIGGANLHARSTDLMNMPNYISAGQARTNGLFTRVIDLSTRVMAARIEVDIRPKHAHARVQVSASVPGKYSEQLSAYRQKS